MAVMAHSKPLLHDSIVACTLHDYYIDTYNIHCVGLKTKGELDPTVPVGIYNGKSFVFRTGTSNILTMLKSLWHYGLSLVKMDFSVKRVLKKFDTIYNLQKDGASYSTVPEMLKAMGGEDMSSLIQVSAHDHFTKLGWSKELIDQLITGAMRMNYGQTTSVNAFCTYVSLAGMEDGSLWSVVGGNWQIPEKVLEASGATFHKKDVMTVTRVSTEGKVQYKITTEDGADTGGDFDVVIIANPLNTSAINFLNFPTAIYSSATTTPYQRTVSEFVQGRINKSFFNISDTDKGFPQVILTTEMTGAPFDFRCVAIEVPSEAPQEEVKDYFKSFEEEPVRVWKLFTPRPLTEDEKKQMFTEVKDEATVDWLAYPKYHPPEQCPPFILDDGMFYINAIEKAASAMEMSAIGAKNVALLAREYLLKKSSE